MTEQNKQIQNWQEKVRNSFGDESKLYSYLFETMDNFYYRYLENDEYKNLKTQQMAQNIWGASCLEKNMVNALKITDPVIKSGIMNLAKNVPKSQGPRVKYSLWVEIKQLKTNMGELKICSEINWGFPDYQNNELKKNKIVHFKYDDLAIFRKQLALKLEECCELFS